MSKNCGIVLVATGDHYQVEAIECARSFREKMPQVPIILYTRGEMPAAGPFDRIEQLSPGINSFTDKIDAIARWAFDRMLYLDTDTICVEPVNDLFDALDRWDVAVAHAPVRRFDPDPPELPDYFPELNTGVIALRKNRITVELVRRWQVLHQMNCNRLGPRAADQPGFRRALWQSDARLLTLTPEYNLRTCMAYLIGGNAAVKIIHDRGQRAHKALRQSERERIKTYPRIR